MVQAILGWLKLLRSGALFDAVFVEAPVHIASPKQWAIAMLFK